MYGVSVGNVLALLARLSDTVEAVLSQFVSRFYRLSLYLKSTITTWTDEQRTSSFKKDRERERENTSGVL
jgi:hypothetical protein